jgi:hypothetical protein
MSQSPGPTNRFSGLRNWIWPLVLIAVGAYRYHHEMHTTFAPVGNVVMIALGLVWLALAALSTSAGGTPSAAARRVAEQQKVLYGGLHEFRDATDSDFLPLDRAFYDAATADLTADGFQHVRDLVDVTTSNSWPANHAVLRCFVGNSHSTMGTVYDVRIYGATRVFQLLGLIPRKLKVVEFETELSDGTYVTTANDATSNKTLGYPFADRVQFPPDTPRDQLIKSHRAHLNAVLASKPGVQAVVIHSYKDLRASQDRLQFLKNTHRTSPNFDHRAEWEKVAGRPLRPHEVQMADEVAANLQSSDPPR